MKSYDHPVFFDCFLSITKKNFDIQDTVILQYTKDYLSPNLIKFKTCISFFENKFKESYTLRVLICKVILHWRDVLHLKVLSRRELYLETSCSFSLPLSSWGFFLELFSVFSTYLLIYRSCLVSFTTSLNLQSYSFVVENYLQTVVLWFDSHSTLLYPSLVDRRMLVFQFTDLI